MTPSLWELGACSGISAVLSKIPADEPFMLVWSDLILPKAFEFPAEEGDYIGLSKGFPCRRRCQDDRFEGIPFSEEGVADLFLFREKEFCAKFSFACGLDRLTGTPLFASGFRETKKRPGTGRFSFGSVFYTSSMTAISAASPRRGPSFVTRV